MDFEIESHQLLGAAIEVHRALGPGLLESVYARCLARELRLRGLPIQTELPIPVTYKGVRIEEAYRLDLVIARKLIVEVKRMSKLERIHHAQLLTYMRLTGIKVGFLLNFNVPLIRNGFTRLVL